MGLIKEEGDNEGNLMRKFGARSTAPLPPFLHLQPPTTGSLAMTGSKPLIVIGYTLDVDLPSLEYCG